MADTHNLITIRCIEYILLRNRATSSGNKQFENDYLINKYILATTHVRYT